MDVKRIIVGPLSTNCYIICEGNDCLIIDPGDDYEDILRATGSRRILGVVVTHGHFDHTDGALDLVSRVNASFYINEHDWKIYDKLNILAKDWGFNVKPLPRNPIFIGEGFELPLGLRVIHTPGHTPGSISIIGNGFIITGDTLFSGTVGRTDLLGGDPELLRRSVCRLYNELPSDFVVYPGHGPETTIGYERDYNPIISIDSCK